MLVIANINRFLDLGMARQLRKERAYVARALFQYLMTPDALDILLAYSKFADTVIAKVNELAREPELAHDPVMLRFLQLWEQLQGDCSRPAL